MNFLTQMGVQSFDEIVFSKEPNVGFVIIKIIGFASTIIVGFDPHIAEVRDLGIRMMHSRFFHENINLDKKQGKE
jgi:hypothetical protein